MSRSLANEKRSEVITYTEVVLLFVLFAYLFYMLFPGKLNYKQILGETSNYELSMVYLENMLRLEPENSELMLAVTKLSLESGKLELAKELITLLQKSNRYSTKQATYLMTYQLYKTQYLKSQTAEQKKKARHQMQTLLHKVASKGLFRHEDALKWYFEAMAQEQLAEAMLFLKSRYQTGDLFALEQCAYVATSKAFDAERQYCIEQLSQRSESANSKKWLVAAYQLYLDREEIPKALKILHMLCERDASYQDELARLQHSIGHFEEAASVYRDMLEANRQVEIRKYYLNRAIDVLREGRRYQALGDLIQTYEAEFAEDVEMLERFIAVYLEMQNVQEARRLSLQLLKKEM